MQERDSYKHQITDLKSRCEEKKEKVDEERLKFMEFKKQVALNALNSRSGRPIPLKVIILSFYLTEILVVLVLGYIIVNLK